MKDVVEMDVVMRSIRYVQEAGSEACIGPKRAPASEFAPRHYSPGNSMATVQSTTTIRDIRDNIFPQMAAR